MLAAMLVVPAGWGGTLSDVAHGSEPGSRWQGRWYSASPATLGFDANKLAAAITNIGRMRGVQGLLLVRKGYLVSERYWRGGGRDKPHNLKSASKSVISTLVGIAIANGYLRLDHTISDLLPVAKLPKDSAKRGITVYHLLTMTSGLTSTSYDAYNDWVRHPDWVTAALQQPLAAPPGTEYRYSTGNTHILSAILAMVTGNSTREFAERELFEPMGVTVAGWQIDPSGLHLGGNNLSLLPRDAAKFGQLYLDKGRWLDRQLIPPTWVTESTRAQGHGSHDTYGRYGFLWWTQSPADGGFAAVGYGGQYVLVSPYHDSVVVVLSNVVSKGDRWEQQMFELLKRGVLDSLVDPIMPPAILEKKVATESGDEVQAAVTAIATTNVNLRAEPRLTAKRLALIPEGSQVDVLQRDGAWISGRFNGKTGWLHWDYIDWLALKSEESEPAVSTVAKHTAETDVTSIGQGSTAATNNWTITDDAEREPVSPVAGPSRSDHTRDGDGESPAALKARLDHVRSQLRELQALLKINAPQAHYRTTARINFRRSPGLHGAWLRIIEPEFEFLALSREGDWLKANIDGVEGWLHSDFAEAVALSPPPDSHADLAAELSVVADIVKKLLAGGQLNETQADAERRAVAQLEQELKQTLARLQTVEVERSRLDREHREAREKLVIAGITRSQREQELDAAQKEIATLEHSLQTEKELKQSLAGNISEFRRELLAKGHQLAEYADMQKRRESALEAARTRITKLEHGLQQQQLSNRRLTEELGRVRDRNDIQRRQMGQLDEQQVRRARALKAARVRIAKLEAARQRELAEKKSMDADLARLRDEQKMQAERFQHTLQEARESQRALTDQLASLSAGHEALRRQFDALAAVERKRVKELETTNAQVGELEHSMLQQNATRQAMVDDLSRIADVSEKQSRQLARLDAENNNNTQQIEATRAELESYRELRSRVQVLEEGSTPTAGTDSAMGRQVAGQSPARKLVPEASAALILPPASTEYVTADVVAQLSDLVRAWAAAWSKQDVEAYLAFYSREFRPTGATNRNAWEALRRRRLSRPAFIKVGINELQITVLGAKRARATFHQAYHADRYQDNVLKTLELVREDVQWRIIRETNR